MVGDFTSGHLTWSDMDNGRKVKTLGTLDAGFLEREPHWSRASPCLPDLKLRAGSFLRLGISVLC